MEARELSLIDDVDVKALEPPLAEKRGDAIGPFRGAREEVQYTRGALALAQQLGMEEV